MIGSTFLVIAELGSSEFCAPSWAPSTAQPCRCQQIVTACCLHSGWPAD